MRLCWLQETDALQEFWKQTRLALFSRPWLLLLPLFFPLKIQAGSIQILLLSIFIVISRELPGIPPIGKYVILSKMKEPIVCRERNAALIKMHRNLVFKNPLCSNSAHLFPESLVISFCMIYGEVPPHISLSCLLLAFDVVHG